MATSAIRLNDRTGFKDGMKRALDFDRSKAVALTIDLQREYLDETVGQAVLRPAQAERVVSANAALLDRCRELGIPVVHAYVVRRQFETDRGFHTGGLAYMRAAHEHGLSQVPHRPARTRPDRVAGTPEAEMPAVLVGDGDIHVTEKKSLDSFMATSLEFLLGRILDARFIIVGGINTDTCVYATTFTAANLGYAPIVVSDCVASMRGDDNHEMALELMSRSIAWVLTLDETLALLDGDARAS